MAGKVQRDALPTRTSVEDRFEIVQHVVAVARPAMDEDDRRSLTSHFIVDGDSLNRYLHSTSLLCHHEQVTIDTPATPKPRRALAWWGAGLMIVGVLLAIVGGAFFIGTAGSKVIETFTAPVRATPSDFTDDLDEGTYAVYELTGRTRGSGPITTTRGGPVTITPSAIEVVSASGASVPVEGMGLTETIDRNGEKFTGAARFTVVEPGVHRITVLGERATDHRGTEYRRLFRERSRVARIGRNRRIGSRGRRLGPADRRPRARTSSGRRPGRSRWCARSRR